jgi:hypothetical protein
MRYILSILLVSATSLMADPVYWPASPRVPAKTGEVWVKCEGGSMRNLRLNVNGVNLDLTYLGKFSIATSDSNWNATLIYPEQPSIRLGITVFDIGTWMPDLTTNTLKNYILGLQIKGATDISSTIDKTFTDDMMILSDKPDVVNYTLGNIRRQEYFVIQGPKIIVFTYEAPASLFEAKREIAKLIFGRAVIR